MIAAKSETVEFFKYIFALFLLFISQMLSNYAASLYDGDDNTQYANQIKAHGLEQPSASLLSRAAILGNKGEHPPLLSPSGLRVAYTIKNGPLTELWVQGLPTGKPFKVLTTKSVNSLTWSKDSRYLVFQYDNKVTFAEAKPNATPVLLTSLKHRHEAVWYGLGAQPELSIIVHLKNMQTDNYQLVEIGLDGYRRVLFSSPFQVDDMLFSAQSDNEKGRKNGSQLSFVKLFKHGRFEISQVNSEGTASLEQLEHVAECEVGDPCQLLSADIAAQKLYINARFTEDKAALYALDLNTKQVIKVDGKRAQTTTSPIAVKHFDQSKFDLTGVLFTDNLNGNARLPEVLIIDDLYRSFIGLSNTAKIKLARTLQHFESSESYLHISTSSDGRYWLAQDLGANRLNNQIIWIDHSNDLTVAVTDSILQTHQTLPLLSTTQVLEYQTSDGMWQFGYLTLPKFASDKALPLVVYPHGGPWARNNASLDRMASFIASRGYAVWQPNFRASTGMGREYTHSANKDFGNGRVQQDIMESLAVLKKHPNVSLEQKAIVGHSFGGFSVLSALSFAPEEFEFGFAGAPPTELGHAIRFIQRQNHRDRESQGMTFLSSLTADPDDTDELDTLKHKSPHNHWQRIQKPLYVWAGKYDKRVDIRQVREYATLVNSKTDLSLLVDLQSGHSPSHDISLEAYLYLLESSLAKHLGGKLEPIATPKLTQYLERVLVIDENEVLNSKKL